MRVAFGQTVLERGKNNSSLDGIGNYTRELFGALQQFDDICLIPFSFSSTALGHDSLQAGSFAPQALRSLLTKGSFKSISLKLENSVDIIHATDHLIPRVNHVPVVATVMDAIPLTHPEWAFTRGRRLKKHFWQQTLRWADHIITISNYSKEQLVSHLGLSEHQVTTIPLGVAQSWFQRPTTEQKETIFSRFNLPEQFFLFVGTIQPRKNLSLLLTAHALLPDNVRRAVPLVVVGRHGWGCRKELQQLRRGDEGSIRWLEYVSDADLIPIVGLSTALVFPSLLEGFGLPVLEAFAAGVPVVCANTTSLPEVAGEAALLFDPTNVSQLSQAMERIVRDTQLAKSLCALGRQRAEQYSWDQTARLTRDVYNDICNR